MCGISGILGGRHAPAERAARVAGMMARQRHRGPDEDGSYHDNLIALGHNRLSIIDLATGRQPLWNETRTLVLVYNGEIYNYPELRRDLLACGHQFATNTDSEVVLHACEEWGDDALPRFNGMFAFALWDIARQELLLARDRLGIKPLYLRRGANDELSFASESKAFAALPGADPAPDPFGLAQYLSLQTCHGSGTLWRGVEKLEPGTLRRYGADGRVREHRYHTLAVAADGSRSFADWTAEYRATLDAAVRRHLLADVRVGAYLSGGFDSGLVTATAAQALAPAPLLTFNGSFAEGGRYDESPLAALVAARHGTEHHAVRITAADFRDSFDRLIYHLDEPMMGPGAFSQYVVAREIARHVKVVLTGHGGDEFFAGYPVYKAALLRGGHCGRAALGGLRPAEAVNLAYFLLFPLVRPLLRHGLHVLFTPGETERLLRPAWRTPDLAARLEAAVSGLAPAELPPFEQLLLRYLRGYLPGLFLVEDKIGMAHSLESRTPLCDNALLDLALRVPWRHKLRGGELKAIPRAAGRDLLPAELYRQPKRGFPTPVHRWFRGELREWVAARLLAPGTEEWLDPVAVRAVWDRFLALRGDNLYVYNHGCRVFSLLSLITRLRQVSTGDRVPGGADNLRHEKDKS